MMKKLIFYTALLSAFSNAQAQQSGPLYEILQRLDTFVAELDDLDIQTETLENPSLDNRILDALSIKICGSLTGSGILQGTAKPIKGEAEGGVGIGPNIMGTGVEVKIEPKIAGNIHLTVKGSASIKSSACVDIYKLARVIQTELQDPNTLPNPDPELAALENFARSLDANAQQQILQFAQYSPGAMLELMVAVLKDAGIDPTQDANSLADGFLAAVNTLDNATVDLTPSQFLNTAQWNTAVQDIPLASQFKTMFHDAQNEFAGFTAFDVSPCNNADLPRGLVGLLDEICGINSLVNNISSYLQTLERVDNTLGASADAVISLANTVKNGAIDTTQDLIDLVGDVEDVFNGVKDNICRTYEASEGGGLLGVSCDASISFNPCSVSSINISFSCSGP